MTASPRTARLWLDVRSAGDTRRAISEEAVHQRFDAIVADDPADLAALPPTVTRVLAPAGGRLPTGFGTADVVLLDPAAHGDPGRLAEDHPDVRFGRWYTVDGPDVLEQACEAVRGDGLTVLTFVDPTNIPMEIVLAAADRSPGVIITTAGRVDDAIVHLSVLEHGPDGVMLTSPAPGDATRLAGRARTASAGLELVTMTVTGVRHVGTGERACVDTCALLRPDEGILVGSWARALLLCVSETHPLPYMPTRPFRVNAGAIMSYTMAGGGRTRYLSELGAGDTVLAVGADGRTRPVTVGRVKIETRPLLAIDATAPGGEPVSLIVQDDWHVRVLGPGGTVLNSTELRAGDEVLGHLPGRERHVGYPIDELCHER
ncbi:3-dehydroquinate synthase II family protein [Actinoplanes sp. NPDC026670]|uniref:3-dehydroquinate synthase II family protein n=1 Tax=Actinoplanes sp. NPDC026670 TaxID=3154700 RepID=UPI0033C4B451